MNTAGTLDARTSTVRSADGTEIAYHSLGSGPGLVVVGGVLSEGSDYMGLARALGGEFAVHIVERRGRPGSGPQRDDHSLDDECADLAAVTADSGSAIVFGHSFGGLVALEAARRQPIFDHVFVYEPGVPIRGQIRTDWLDDYHRRLQRGDRRGAFATMVRSAGFAPPALAMVPVWCVRLILRFAIKGDKWARMDRLLEANLVEHRIQASLDAPDPCRFSTITSRVTLLGGAKSPASISGPLLQEIATVIPSSDVEVLPGLGHLAPQENPDEVATAILAHRGPSGPAHLPS
jgi:pimeloyl-ACP methyl ester carboxylesterase